MCGIGYLNKMDSKRLSNIIQSQVSRGTDAYGYIGRGVIDKHDTKNAFITTYGKLCAEATLISKGNWIAWHTRKASIGKKDIMNAHPHVLDDLVIMQNGTERAFIEWGKLALLDKFDDGKTDTHYVGEFLLEKEKIGLTFFETLKVLVEGEFTLGAVFVQDRVSGSMYFATDGTRDTHITVKDGKVIEISSEGFMVNEDIPAEEKRLTKNNVVIHFDPETGEIFDQVGEITNTDNGLVNKIITRYGGYGGNYQSTTTASQVKQVKVKKKQVLGNLMRLTGGVTKRTIWKQLLNTYDTTALIKGTLFLIGYAKAAADKDVKLKALSIFKNGDTLKAYFARYTTLDQDHLEGELLELKTIEPGK